MHVLHTTQHHMLPCAVHTAATVQAFNPWICTPRSPDGRKKNQITVHVIFERKKYA